MGRKKAFINKRKSATFQLLARDSSSSAAGGEQLSDRVFVRVDSNPYSPHGFVDDEGADEVCHLADGDVADSIFADAPGDTDDEDDCIALQPYTPQTGLLPEHVRKEILELGLPDDGYNYLFHLRQIRNTGGGSAYYHNSKARLDRVPLDVKAYDASKLRIISEAGDESSAQSMYTVASTAVGTKVQRVLDPEVVRLLDDSDLSRFGSDVEDLDEDFVVQANRLEGVEEGEKVYRASEKEINQEGVVGVATDARLQEDFVVESVQSDGLIDCGIDDKPRVRRLLDEQFDLLTLREYDDDSDTLREYDDDSDNDDHSYSDVEVEPLAVKLNNALKGYGANDLELGEKYKVPGDFVTGNQGSGTDKQLSDSADVIRKCMEYAEVYNSQDDEDVVLVRESSDESDVWDCETIVSTYSNLDNHPIKIQAPEITKKRITKSQSSNTISKSTIALRGKEKLPLDFLPQRRQGAHKVQKAASAGADKQRRRPHREESKEEKKERKAAVKEEKRDARRTKKELKGLYRCETQRAQMVAAISGPSAIPLK